MIFLGIFALLGAVGFATFWAIWPRPRRRSARDLALTLGAAAIVSTAAIALDRSMLTHNWAAGLTLLVSAAGLASVGAALGYYPAGVTAPTRALVRRLLFLGLVWLVVGATFGLLAACGFNVQCDL